MRKVVVIMVAITLGLTTVVNAKMLPTVAIKVPDQLKEVISTQLDYPNKLSSEFLEGEVWMKLYVSETSEINIVDLSATNPELGAYVKKEISSLYVNESGCKKGQIYFLKVKFDLVNI